LAIGLNVLGSGLAEDFGMQVVTLFGRWLVFFCRNPVGIGVSVVTDASHLPRNSYGRFARPNYKAVIGNLLRNNRLGKLAHHGQPVAEITVECFEIVGENDGRKSTPIRCNVPVVDVHHVGRFDERVGEILVRRIERMVGPFGARIARTGTTSGRWSVIWMVATSVPNAVTLFAAMMLHLCVRARSARN
jgi:hypothetical protein